MGSPRNHHEGDHDRSNNNGHTHNDYQDHYYNYQEQQQRYPPPYSANSKFERKRKRKRMPSYSSLSGTSTPNQTSLTHSHTQTFHGKDDNPDYYDKRSIYSGRDDSEHNVELHYGSRELTHREDEVNGSRSSFRRRHHDSSDRSQMREDYYGYNPKDNNSQDDDENAACKSRSEYYSSKKRLSHDGSQSNTNNHNESRDHSQRSGNVRRKEMDNASGDSCFEDSRIPNSSSITEQKESSINVMKEENELVCKRSILHCNRSDKRKMKSVSWGHDTVQQSSNKNYCNIKGHNHLWKHCPNNPYCKKVNDKNFSIESQSYQRKDSSNQAKNSTQKAPKQNLCRLIGHHHLWKDCPCNPLSVMFNKNSTQEKDPQKNIEKYNEMCKVALTGMQAEVKRFTNIDVNYNNDKPCALPKSLPSINSILGSNNVKNATLKIPPLVLAASESCQDVQEHREMNRTNCGRGLNNVRDSDFSKEERSKKMRKVTSTGVALHEGMKSFNQSRSETRDLQCLQYTDSNHGAPKVLLAERGNIVKNKTVHSSTNTSIEPIVTATHAMPCQKKTQMLVAPLGNNAIPLKKHKTSRLISNQGNFFADHESRFDFEKKVIEADNSQMKKSESNVLNGSSIICLDSATDGADTVNPMHLIHSNSIEKECHCEETAITPLESSTDSDNERKHKNEGMIETIAVKTSSIEIPSENHQHTIIDNNDATFTVDEFLTNVGLEGESNLLTDDILIEMEKELLRAIENSIKANTMHSVIPFLESDAANGSSCLQKRAVDGSTDNDKNKMTPLDNLVYLNNAHTARNDLRTLQLKSPRYDHEETQSEPKKTIMFPDEKIQDCLRVESVRVERNLDTIMQSSSDTLCTLGTFFAESETRKESLSDQNDRSVNEPMEKLNVDSEPSDNASFMGKHSISINPLLLPKSTDFTTHPDISIHNHVIDQSYETIEGAVSLLENNGLTTHPFQPVPDNHSLNQNVPCFWFCNKCHLVFSLAERNEAWRHEIICTTVEPSDHELHDESTLLSYEAQNSGTFNMDSKFYFEPKRCPIPVNDFIATQTICQKLNKSPSMQEIAGKLQKHLQKWDLKYNAICQFKKDHGHINLPKNFEPSKELGNLDTWLKIQMLKYHRGKLPPSHSSMLKCIGVDFERKKHTKRNWISKYNALCQFKRDNGHINIPVNFQPNKDLGNLDTWLKTQRGKYHKGLLSPDSVKMLEDLGVNFERTKNSKKDAKLIQQSSNYRDECMVESLVMNTVEQLSSSSMISGLPLQKLTVLEVSSETLHHFQVDIRQSNIFNSGYGTFLTYLGAQVLTSEAKNRSTRLIAEHIAMESIFCGPLIAVTRKGLRVTVTLKGTYVPISDKGLYWTKAKSNAYTKHIRHKDQYLTFDENNVNCETSKEVQRLQSCIPEGERIGFLGIHSAADYINDDSISFWSFPDGLIELGRYGPFRPADRKPQLYFDVKNFIFDFEPSEWSYGTSDSDEIIDITENTTGKIHSIAKENTPIYVNEVGHGSGLHQNVVIREKGEGAVYYYIAIDERHAMKKGDTVELLANYGELYESVRERKGYGLINISKCLGGDWEERSRLQRNFKERKDIEDLILNLSFLELFHLAEFVSEEILDSLRTEIDTSPPRKIMIVKLLVARRRAHWLGEIFERRLELLLAVSSDPNTKGVRNDVGIFEKSPHFVSALRDNLSRWKFTSASFNNPLTIDSFTDTGLIVCDVILNEISEELLYHVSHRVPRPLFSKPMDESIWCKVGINLTKSAACIIARYHFRDSPQKKDLEDLSSALFGEATASAHTVRRGARAINGPSKISNDSFSRYIDLLSLKTNSATNVTNQVSKFLNSTKSSMFLYNSPSAMCSRIIAALAEIKAYKDALDLCSVERSYSISDVSRLLSSCDLTVVSFYSENSFTDATRDGSNMFQWIPRNIEAFTKGVAQVNEYWYLATQVVLVVHALASTGVDWKYDLQESNRHIYSLEKLCQLIDFDFHFAKQMLSQRSIVPTSAESEGELLLKSGTATVTKKKKCGNSEGAKDTVRQCKKNISLPLANHKQLVYDGPDPNLLGWNVQKVQRANAYHVDSYWTHPELKGIKVRSRVGVLDLIETMNIADMDMMTAYNHVDKIKARRYFQRDSSQ